MKKISTIVIIFLLSTPLLRADPLPPKVIFDKIKASRHLRKSYNALSDAQQTIISQLLQDILTTEMEEEKTSQILKTVFSLSPSHFQAFHALIKALVTTYNLQGAIPTVITELIKLKPEGYALFQSTLKNLPLKGMSKENTVKAIIGLVQYPDQNYEQLLKALTSLSLEKTSGKERSIILGALFETDPEVLKNEVFEKVLTLIPLKDLDSVERAEVILSLYSISPKTLEHSGFQEILQYLPWDSLTEKQCGWIISALGNIDLKKLEDPELSKTFLEMPWGKLDSEYQYSVVGDMFNNSSVVFCGRNTFFPPQYKDFREILGILNVPWSTLEGEKVASILVMLEFLSKVTYKYMKEDRGKEGALAFLKFFNDLDLPWGEVEDYKTFMSIIARIKPENYATELALLREVRPFLPNDASYPRLILGLKEIEWLEPNLLKSKAYKEALKKLPWNKLRGDSYLYVPKVFMWLNPSDYGRFVENLQNSPDVQEPGESYAEIVKAQKGLDYNKETRLHRGKINWTELGGQYFPRD